MKLAYFYATFSSCLLAHVGRQMLNIWRVVASPVAESVVPDDVAYTHDLKAPLAPGSKICTNVLTSNKFG